MSPAAANENLLGGFEEIPGITPRVAPRLVVFTLLNRRKPEGDGGKGTAKKKSRQFVTNVTTNYDIL